MHVEQVNPVTTNQYKPTGDRMWQTYVHIYTTHRLKLEEDLKEMYVKGGLPGLENRWWRKNQWGGKHWVNIYKHRWTQWIYSGWEKRVDVFPNPPLSANTLCIFPLFWMAAMWQSFTNYEKPEELSAPWHHCPLRWLVTWHNNESIAWIGFGGFFFHSSVTKASGLQNNRGREEWREGG